MSPEDQAQLHNLLVGLSQRIGGNFEGLYTPRGMRITHSDRTL